MRHWAQGLPPQAAPPVLGRPPRAWLQLFLLCHEPGRRGWRRVEWPDGGALLAQPWPQVLALRAIGDELGRIEAERLRAAARRQGGGTVAG